MSAVSPHTCMKTPVPVDTCIVSDVVVDAIPYLQRTLFQFVSVMHLRLTDSLLHEAPCLLVNRIDIGAVWWPKIWCTESRCWLHQKSYSVTCPVCRGVVLLESEELAPHVAHHRQQLLWQKYVMVEGTIDLDPWINEIEVHAAKLWDTDWNRDRSTKRCSGARQTFSSSMFLLRCYRNIQTVILQILWSRHGDNLLITEPHEIHLVVWTCIQQQCGLLQSISPVQFGQPLHRTLLHTSDQGRYDYRMPVSLKISHMEQWVPVFGCFSWLSANSLTETFNAVRVVLACLGRPLSFFRLTISRKEFTQGTPFPVFLRKLAHQFLSSIAFGEIKVLMRTLSS